MEIKYSAIVLLLLTSFVFGCGTAHHFVPHRPLEKSEWQATVYWHFDLDNPVPRPFPELSAYYGATDNFNLGFGAHALIHISHLSLARYWPNPDDSYLALYAHANQFFSLNNNPYLETGLIYSKDYGGWYQTVGVGLAYGHGGNVIGGLARLSESRMGSLQGSKKRFMPTFKYQIGGEQIGFSYIQYYGKSKSTYHRTVEQLETDNDTLFIIATSQIDTIIKLSGPWGVFPRPGWKIICRTGDTLVLHRQLRQYAGCMIIGIESITYNDYVGRFMNLGYGVYRIGHHHGLNLLEEPRLAVLDPEALFANWETRDQLIITEFPTDLKARLPSDRPRYHDHSVALGIHGHRLKEKVAPNIP